MPEHNIDYASLKQMGQINLVNIQSDLGTFGMEYPSFTFSKEDLKSSIEQKNVMTIEKDALVIAFIKFMRDPQNNYGYIHQISVLPEHQRQGAAKKLINKTIVEMRHENLNHIGLTTTKETPWGQNLYNNMGFKELDLNNAPPSWHDHIKQEMGDNAHTKMYMELEI